MYLPQLHPPHLKSKLQKIAGFVLCVLEKIYIDISQVLIEEFFVPPPPHPSTSNMRFLKILVW